MTDSSIGGHSNGARYLMDMVIGRWFLVLSSVWNLPFEIAYRNAFEFVVVLKLKIAVLE